MEKQQPDEKVYQTFSLDAWQQKKQVESVIEFHLPFRDSFVSYVVLFSGEFFDG
jgi:hypothetical protein